MRVWKGHGTENDFVVLSDLDAGLDLTPDAVRALCDRHAGIGADGVLRVVRAATVPEFAEQAADAEFAMDYRNADGSVAEMCGNGIRVFARYLSGAGLIGRSTVVATRGGPRQVRLNDDGTVTVDMGSPGALAQASSVTVAGLPGPLDGRAITMPNPHIVVTVPDADTLGALDLSRPPGVVPALPEGQNVEFVADLGPRHLRMRVHERGVGETRSCGTGICAVAVDAARRGGVDADGVPWRVEVPGGRCSVVWRAEGTSGDTSGGGAYAAPPGSAAAQPCVSDLGGTVELTGPAVLVAEITLAGPLSPRS